MMFSNSYSDSISEILNRNESLKTFQKGVNTLLSHINQIMEKNTEDSIIKIKESLKKLQMLQENIPNLEFIPPNIHIHNTITPNFKRAVIEIVDFQELVNDFSSEEIPRFIISQPFTLGAQKWRAKVYPNGNQNGFNSHVSFFLELLSKTQNQLSYHYRVEIVSRNNSVPNFCRECTSLFTQNEAWGWNRFIPLSSILSKDFLDEKGTIKTIIGIRPLSYFQAYQENIEAIKILHQKCQNLKSDLQK